MGGLKILFVVPIILIIFLCILLYLLAFPYKQNAKLVVYSNTQDKEYKSNKGNREDYQVLGESIKVRTATPTPKPSVNTSINQAETKEILSSGGVSVTVANVLSALNVYRASRGKSSLGLDNSLQSFAQSRASYFASRGSTDQHAGFNDLISNQDGFNKLGFMALGENSSYGYQISAQDLISVAYGGHGPHDQNQLDDRWTHVGIGIAGSATDIVFGGRKK